ncbi:hypothetical protein BXZ70DRAFT_702483 [Cristinia sonorae]|uniref:Uncharacterized protein n=1 Tax=Cristinia sonorae TaxID=1940300 RepID=A0A8K0UE57_9AGAR|nr:hypothetical protein BXZ70DRAFT_702483 [Cristinia sonorae]
MVICPLLPWARYIPFRDSTPPLLTLFSPPTSFLCPPPYPLDTLIMPNQRDDQHDPHVLSLRLALGSILSPKRSPSSRSSTATSGTASPMHPHHLHGHSHLHNSHSPEQEHSPLPAEHQTPVATSGSSRATRLPLARAQTESSITSAATASRTSASDSIPSTVPPMSRPSSVPVSAVPSEDPSHPNASRTDFIGTLRSKSAWEALIHGSFV